MRRTGFVSLPSCLVLLFLATALAIVLAVVPAGPPPAPEQAKSSPSEQLVRSLNAAIQSVESDLERLRLAGTCRLRLRPVDADPVQVNLMALGVRTDSDPESGSLQLFLAPQPGASDLLLLATDSWPIWAAALSDIHQLRGLCARFLMQDSRP